VRGLQSRPSTRPLGRKEYNSEGAWNEKIQIKSVPMEPFLGHTWKTLEALRSWRKGGKVYSGTRAGLEPPKEKRTTGKARKNVGGRHDRKKGKGGALGEVENVKKSPKGSSRPTRSAGMCGSGRALMGGGRKKEQRFAQYQRRQAEKKPEKKREHVAR